MTTTDPADRCTCSHARRNHAASGCPVCNDCPEFELSERLTAIWREAENTAARASEAPGDAQSPTPDVGAAQGGEGGSAAESEPRDTVKRRILEALDRWHELGLFEISGEFAGVMEAVDAYANAIRAQAVHEERLRLSSVLHERAQQSRTHSHRMVFGIASRIVAPDLTPEEIGRAILDGNFVVCDIPDDPARGDQ